MIVWGDEEKARALALAGGMDPRDPWRDAAEALGIAIALALSVALVRAAALAWTGGR